MNILLFGPNGSGKGTQGALMEKRFNIPHIEPGVIFRDNFFQGTDLGKKAIRYMDKGELVPDEITIPMILNRLKQPDCAGGWLLDGFPRNLNQARKLDQAIMEIGLTIDYIVEIVLPRQGAKERIMGRRLCVNDHNHPNNVFIESIKPARIGGREVCRICGGELETRSDDQDEGAIDKRHDIYFDVREGTLAAVTYFKEKKINGQGQYRVIELDGRPGVKEVSEEFERKIQQ